MESFLKKATVLFIRKVLVLIPTILFSFESFAQNANGSAMKRANINTNWYAQSWFWALVVALVIILIGIIGNRQRNKNLDQRVNDLKKTK